MDNRIQNIIINLFQEIVSLMRVAGRECGRILHRKCQRIALYLPVCSECTEA